MADLDLSKFFNLEEKDYTLAQSVPAGIKKGYDMATSYLKQLKTAF